MNLRKRIKDSFIFGFISGLLSLALFYFLLNALRMALVNSSGNPYLMKPPQVQLLTMLINIIIFRLLIVNLDKESTGKGFLFSTVLITLGYFYFYFNIAG